MSFQMYIAEGYIGQDIELKYSAGGSAYCKFSVAVTKKLQNGNKETEWLRCVSFSGTAESIAKFFGKGKGIVIFGELKTSQWEKDGVKHERTEVMVNRFSFPCSSGGSGQGQGQGQYSGQNPQQNRGNQRDSSYNGFFEGGGGHQSMGGTHNTANGQDEYFSTPPDDDIPF